MPIRFTLEGITFEADTPEEAFQAATIIRDAAAKTKAAPPKTPPRSFATIHPQLIAEEPGYATFLKTLNDNGKKIVFALADAPDGLDTDGLAAAAGLETMSLPPIIKHVRTCAQRAGVNGETIIRRRDLSIHGRPVSGYVLDETAVFEVNRLK